MNQRGCGSPCDLADYSRVTTLGNYAQCVLASIMPGKRHSGKFPEWGLIRHNPGTGAEIARPQRIAVNRARLKPSQRRQSAQPRQPETSAGQMPRSVVSSWREGGFSRRPLRRVDDYGRGGVAERLRSLRCIWAGADWRPGKC